MDNATTRRVLFLLALLAAGAAGYGAAGSWSKQRPAARQFTIDNDGPAVVVIIRFDDGSESAARMKAVEAINTADALSKAAMRASAAEVATKRQKADQR